MIDHDLSIYFVRYGLGCVCLCAMMAGILVLRWAPDWDPMRDRTKFTFRLFGALAVVAGPVAYFAVAPEAAAWVALLYASYCAGALIEIAESDPARAKAAIKAFLIECGRQWGKVPTSH